MKTIRKVTVIAADPIAWLKEKDKFEKDHKIKQEITNVALQQVRNPMFGRGGLHHPGQPQFLMQTIIISALVYEIEVEDDYIEAPVVQHNLKINQL
jgi:hypothetical protein